MNPEQIFSLLDLIAEQRAIMRHQREALDDLQKQVNTVRQENAVLVSENAGLKNSTAEQAAAP